jgi:hypothetical protein
VEWLIYTILHDNRHSTAQAAPVSAPAATSELPADVHSHEKQHA